MPEIMISKDAFDELLRSAEALLTDHDFEILKSYGKEEAIGRLHFSAGHLLRNALGLWNDENIGVLKAIERYAHQGPLLGFDADGASSALLGNLWDSLHSSK